MPLATPHPSPAPPNVKMNRSVGYSYPALPPGYQNTSAPGAPGMQASALQYPDGSKHFHQVKVVWFSSWYYLWCKEKVAVDVGCCFDGSLCGVLVVQDDRRSLKEVLLLMHWHQFGKAMCQLLMKCSILEYVQNASLKNTQPLLAWFPSPGLPVLAEGFGFFLSFQSELTNTSVS